MDISKYTAFFHDGSLLEIKHENNKIELSMSSAEMDEEDLKEPIELSDDGCRDIVKCCGWKSYHAF